MIEVGEILSAFSVADPARSPKEVRAEWGEIDTRPWITLRFTLAGTPTVFPREIAGNPSVLNAMIEVLD